MDISNDNRPDAVMAELKKLREGAGLQRDRLAVSTSLMSSLATADPHQAFEELERLIAGLDDQDQAALEVDFSLNLDHHLGRKPVAQEQRWLGTRRSAYGEVIGRDPKTLARWSDAALLQVRSKLLADTYVGHLYLVVLVKGDRIERISMIQEEEDNDEPSDDEYMLTPSKRKSFDFNNPSSEPSPPWFTYAFPRDWEPKTLTLAVTFIEQPYPATVWGFYAPTFIELSFAQKRQPLEMDGRSAICRFENPPRGQIYGVWWG